MPESNWCLNLMCGRLQIILEVGLEIVMTSFLISGQRQGLASEVENLTKFINCFEVTMDQMLLEEVIFCFYFSFLLWLTICLLVYEHIFSRPP